MENEKTVKEKVTIKQAAEELGLNQEMLRYMMQAKRLPIGEAFKKPGSQRWVYIIYRDWLIGIKQEQRHDPSRCTRVHPASAQNVQKEEKESNEQWIR